MGQGQHGHQYDQERLKAIIVFLGGAFSSLVVNLIAAAIFPSLGTLAGFSWAWFIFGVACLLIALIYPDKGRGITWLRWILALLVLADFIALTVLHQDVPGRFFQGPTLRYQADWAYSLNGWTSPTIGASAQAWSVSQRMLVSSGQLTSFSDPSCPLINQQHIC